MTLLDAIAEFGFDACIGGARRDEEKARAEGTRVLVPRCVRPVGSRRTSAPSSGTSTTRRVSPGEHVRVFPISNWTELDVWQYIARERARRAVDLLRASRARSCAAARAGRR